MPHSAGPSGAAPAAPTTAVTSGAGGYLVHSAPYALVRATVLHHPAQSPPAAAFRTELARTAALEAETAALLPELCDALYASRSGHSPAFHRDVVLPLRRSLHNGRDPRPALLGRLDELPDRVPQLAAYLALRERRADRLAALESAVAGALAAERAALSALCRDPALGRAVALTSADLLRAVERAGSGVDDRRARKEEPNVLRFALRASTKTSPLSWFTAVGWGELPERAAALGMSSWESAALLGEQPAPVVKANRTLVGALCQALLDDPRRRAALAHRMTSTARVADGRAAYARTRVVFAGGRYLVAHEDEVELGAGGPLELIAGLCENPASLRELTDGLDAALGSAGGGSAAAAFLDRLADTGLLVPSEPVNPQDDDPLIRLAQWLRELPVTEGAVADAELADRIDEIARGTRQFASADAADRPALLTDLSTRWTALLADAGRPAPTVAAPLNVLSEDVVARRPLRLDGFLDEADHQALGELTALAELFDLGPLMRRVSRDRFVARFGPGGVCRHVWDFGADAAGAWEEAGQLAALAPGDEGRFPSGAGELAALRRAVVDAVRDKAEVAGADADIVLPADLVRGLGDRLPRWAVARPASYSAFVQRDPVDGLLCVNHVYGGWGRFTSRFLDALDPAAADQVGRQIRRGLGREARVAQIRPVGGFNANLHPLLVPDEIGSDRRWASIGESEVELVHDEASDQLRLRLSATGELLEVLYSGFLAPIMLPRRLAPFLADHPHGVVDFRSLVPQFGVDAPGGRVVRTPRLRHRHLVLRRRRWYLSAGVVHELRAELAADQAVPAAGSLRWRALLGLPEQLFLHPLPAVPGGRAADDFLAQLRQPKPHFIDLGNALHLRSLAKWLSRHPDGLVLEEALPAPGGRDRPAHAVELVVETYRAGRPS